MTNLDFNDINNCLSNYNNKKQNVITGTYACMNTE